MDNIKVLKNHIITLEKNLLSFSGKEIKKRTPLPISHWKYIKYICKAYDVELKIEKLKSSRIGRYNLNKKIIYLPEILNDNKKHTNKRISFFLTLFFHELSHRIQHQLYGESLKEIVEKEDRILEIEKESDSLMHILWEKYIGNTVVEHEGI